MSQDQQQQQEFKYENACNLLKELDQVVKDLHECADNGHVKSAKLLAQMYDYGRDVVEQDVDKRVKYLELAVKHGNDFNSKLHLIYHYMCGSGNDESVYKFIDLSKAETIFEWTKEWSEDDDTRNTSKCSGLNNLGSLYFLGIGTERNLDKGFQCIKEAYENGDLINDTVTANYGLCLLTGVGCEKDPKAAYEAFKKEYDAFVALEVDGKWTDKDVVAASKTNLGVCFLFGLGTTQDKEEGLRLLEQGADGGDSDAMTILGLHRILEDDRLPFECFNDVSREDMRKEAASRLQDAYSFLGARVMLGLCYAYGYGVKRDTKRAKEIFSVQGKSFQDTCVIYRYPIFVQAIQVLEKFKPFMASNNTENDTTEEYFDMAMSLLRSYVPEHLRS